MGFKGMRGWLIIGLIGLAALVLILYIGSSASNMEPAEASSTNKIVTVYIYKNIGIDRIYYENLDNPGESRTITIVDLPCAFNVSRSDVLQFYVVTKAGYEWNTWGFYPVGRSNSDNPLIITANDPLYCYKNRIYMSPDVIILRVSPTASPVPTVEVPPE